MTYFRDKCEFNTEILSANWHFTSLCNYRCKFCCMQKLSGDLRSLERARKVLDRLVGLGIEKINFVGGEPLCNPLIFDVVAVADKLGLVVSVTSNGSLLNQGSLDRLAPHVNWIGLSIDSASGVVERRMGRGDGSHVRHCMNVAPLVHELGMQLKVNTTVTKLTFREDMRNLIRVLDPQRWKVFQFLHVPGQNDDAVASFAITDEEFEEFKACNDNIKLRNGAAPVFESADLMLDSYLMLTPAGNIFLNREYPFREYALESVTKETLPAILNADNYVKRGAIYAW